MRRITVLVACLLIAGLSPGVGWRPCAGWSAAPEVRHACCSQMEHLAMADADGCCAMSERSRDGGPIRAQIAAAAPAVVRAPSHPFAAFRSCPVLGLRSAVRVDHPHGIPLYLQHLALLI